MENENPTPCTCVQVRQLRDALMMLLRAHGQRSDVLANELQRLADRLDAHERHHMGKDAVYGGAASSGKTATMHKAMLDAISPFIEQPLNATGAFTYDQNTGYLHHVTQGWSMHKTAHVHDSAVIGKGAIIREFASVYEGAHVPPNADVRAHAIVPPHHVWCGAQRQTPQGAGNAATCQHGFTYAHQLPSNNPDLDTFCPGPEKPQVTP